jgi:ABC-2 type transport system permease protein
MTMNKHLFSDSATLTGRSLRHIVRSADTIITTAITPIAMLLLFVYVFGGAIDTGADKYVNYLLPGILLVTVASGEVAELPQQGCEETALTC